MIRFILDYFKAFHFSASEKKYLGIVLVLYLGYTLFHIFTYPVYIDEALTYNYFTSKGLTTVFSDYSFPNNHVFFTFLTYLFYYLPIDGLISMRLPNLLIGCGTSFLLYSYLRSLYGHKIAVIPHLFFTFSYFITFYSVFARGYLLIILFTIICFICIQKMKDAFKMKYLLVYSIVSILGFWTIPIFLYAFLTLNAFAFLLFFNNIKRLFQLFLWNMLIGIGVIICYLPILTNQGLDSIINNKWTQRLQFDQILETFKNKTIFRIYDKIIGINSFMLILVFLSLLILVFIISKSRKERTHLATLVLFFILPFFFILLHQVIPGSRTWSYLIFPMVLGFAILLKTFDQFKTIPPSVIYLSAGFTLLVQVYIFQKSHPLGALPADDTANKLTQVVTAKSYRTFYIDEEPESFQEVNICFAFERKKIPYKIYNKQTITPSTSLTKMECIIIKNDEINQADLDLKKKKLIYQNSSHSVFGK